jgi:hypothetical protein
LTDDAEVERIRGLLKAWCELVAKIIRFRRFHIDFRSAWKTDEPPGLRDVMMLTYPSELPSVLEEMMPLLIKAEAALFGGPVNLTTEFAAIKKLAEELGVSVPAYPS